jgi:hypothetical protein
MTPFRNFSTESTWTRRIRRGGLYLAMAAAMAATGCGSSEPEWEAVTVQEPTKGVVTRLKEKADGQYEIVEEKMVERPEDSRIIIQALDGTEKTLTLAEAKGLVQPTDTVQNTQTQHRSHHGLGSTIWYGAMGYVMGRSMSQPVNPGFYASAPQTGGGSSAGKGNLGYIPSSSENIRQGLQSTAVPRTQMRPAAPRSGFFSGSRRSSSSS